MIQRLLAMVLTAVLAAPALAQEEGGRSALIVPDAAREAAVAPWLTMLVLVVLVLIVGIASFKGAKRTHQD